MAIIDFEFFMLIFLKKYAIIILGVKANKKTLLVIIVMNKSKKNIIIVISIVILLALATFFIKQSRIKSNTESIREDVYPYLDEEQKDILEHIISTKPIGLYIYEISNDNGDKYYDKIYGSADYRTLSVDEKHDMFYLQKDGYMYAANSANKKYFKKKIENHDDDSKEYNIEYAELVNSTGDGNVELVDGLKIYKIDKDYVVESNRQKMIFNHNYRLTEEDLYISGVKSKRKLVEYDPDFDKYFNQYYDLIEDYEEVSDINKLDY